MTLHTSTEFDDFERERIQRVDHLRATLLTHLSHGVHTTQQALNTLQRLRDNDIYDAEFVDGRDGEDIGVFLNASIRYLRAAYALVHTVIDKEIP